MDPSKKYTVYRREGKWFFRYTVAYTHGHGVLTVTSTLWGARRAIRREQREQARTAATRWPPGPITEQH